MTTDSAVSLPSLPVPSQFQNYPPGAVIYVSGQYYVNRADTEIWGKDGDYTPNWVSYDPNVAALALTEDEKLMNAVEQVLAGAGGVWPAGGTGLFALDPATDGQKAQAFIAAHPSLIGTHAAITQAMAKTITQINTVVGSENEQAASAMADGYVRGLFPGAPCGAEAVAWKARYMADSGFPNWSGACSGAGDAPSVPLPTATIQAPVPLPPPPPSFATRNGGGVPPSPVVEPISSSDAATQHGTAFQDANSGSSMQGPTVQLAPVGGVALDAIGGPVPQQADAVTLAPAGLSLSNPAVLIGLAALALAVLSRKRG